VTVFPSSRESGWLPDGGRFDGKGEYVTDCPTCGGRGKFYWNPTRRLGHCFGWGCESERIVGQYAYEALFGGADLHGPAVIAIPPRILPATQQAAIPHVRGFSSTVCAWDYPASREFLSGPLPKGRALTERQVREVPLGGDGRRVWVNLDPISKGYDPVAFERPADGSGKWLPPRSGINRAAYAFGLKKWLQSGREQIVLAEGVFDVLSPDLYGCAVAVMGSTFPDALSELLANRAGRIVSAYYWPDDDPAGYSGAKKAMESLAGWGVPCTMVGAGKDPKCTTPSDARQILREVGWLG